MPPGVSSVAASRARARAQEKGFRLDKALWTAKQSSGFSVCSFWSLYTEGLAKQQKNKSKRRMKKTKVVQGPQLPDLPALNLASSEDDLVSVKTPIKAHQENHVSSDQPSQADENDDLVSLGSEAIDLENCDIVVLEVKEDIPRVAYAKRRCDGAGADSEGWWFKSYLSNRQQRTVINGFTSAPCQVTSGVPQGSVPGPLFFIMFMNWLIKVPLSDNTKLILYADDILLYKPVNSDQDSDAFQNWTNSHGLKLNASESCICLMNITRAKYPSRLSISVVKCLGVTISADLT